MNNPKRILFTTENTSWGGSELLWARAVLEMLPFDISITICRHEKLKLPNEIILAEKDDELNIVTYSGGNLSFWKRLANRFLSYNRKFKPSNVRERFIQDLKPDLIVMNQGFNFNAVPLMLFAQNNNLKYVTVSHAVNESLWPNLVLRQKMQLGFKHSLQNYFVSKDNLLTTQNQLSFVLENAEIIRNPFNVPYSIDLDFPAQESFHLACVGRYDFNAKGQDVLLQVLSNEKWKNRHLHFNFYGEGNDLENLKDLVKMYHLNNVTVHNHTTTEEIWKTNHGLILASRFEGLPIVIVEAMLCKRFVIVTNVSGNKELLNDNETGFIAAAPRPEYIDEALERAWQQRMNWEAIGKKARLEITAQIPENPALVFANKLQTLLH
jgi:glycosyltransferase involved in cell wall biosynthesis